MTNKTNLPYFFITSFILFSMVFSPTLAHAQKNAVDAKLQALKKQTEVNRNTLSAPLYLSTLNTPPAVRDLSLFDKQASVGSGGELDFQEVASEVYRLRFKNLQKEASFFWIFEEPKNLRNQWFRLRYSGQKAPEHVLLRLDQGEYHSDFEFDLYLDPTEGAHQVYFKFPDKAPFADIRSMHLIFDPLYLKGQDSDFLLLGIDFVPEGRDPLSQLPATDWERPNWNSDLFQPQNKTYLNVEKSF